MLHTPTSNPALTIGMGFTMIALTSVAVHEFASLTVTVILEAKAGDVVTVAPVAAESPADGVQAYVYGARPPDPAAVNDA